jgi:4-diphosphocytidyl-2-C-methyl-D-erythritol kinase
MAQPLCESAPAKLNLYLHVVGKRDDGYHLLDSLVAFAGEGAGDSLAFLPATELTLRLDGPMAKDLTAEPDNLVLRAARRLAEACGVKQGALITLTKNLPVASGIGGGSADAAAALRGLMRLWGVSPSPETLKTIALSLGADVPVCLEGRAVFMGGIGEEIAPAPKLPACWVTLLNPGIPLATPPVFKARTGPFSPPARFEEPPGDITALARLLKNRRNDLMAPAFTLCPEAAQAVEALGAAEGCQFASMSGSGATAFGLFADEASARLAATKARPGWWAAAAPLIS